MKRLFMFAVVVLPLLFTSCKKDEDFFVGSWSYSEVMNNGEDYSIYFYVRDNGQCDLKEVFSRGAITLEETYFYGSWSLVNEEEIKCRMKDDDGESYIWTFRKKDNKTLYWVGESIDLRTY